MHIHISDTYLLKSIKIEGEEPMGETSPTFQ